MRRLLSWLGRVVDREAFKVPGGYVVATGSWGAFIPDTPQGKEQQ